MSKLEDLIRYGMYGTKRALFITPMMYTSEIISGLDSSQSLKARMISLGVNFFVAMPYNNWFKPKIYEMMGISEESPEYKKDVVSLVNTNVSGEQNKQTLIKRVGILVSKMLSVVIAIIESLIGRGEIITVLAVKS